MQKHGSNVKASLHLEDNRHSEKCQDTLTFYFEAVQTGVDRACVHLKDLMRFVEGGRCPLVGCCFGWVIKQERPGE